MDRISGLSDELLVKILSFVPTKVAFSTSILSKRWESLWMWVPKLEFETSIESEPRDASQLDFINKNLPLLKTPVIESFHLLCISKLFKPEYVSQWLGTAVSRCIREIDIKYFSIFEIDQTVVLLPSSLYTCESLVSLTILGYLVVVDVPRTVCLPSLKTLVLGGVTYANEDSLRLLLSYCPVLEVLHLQRDWKWEAKPIVVISSSLQRLTLPVDGGPSSGEYVIVTPSLKYFEVLNYKARLSCLVAHMPEVEEADIVVDDHLDKLFKSIISVERFSLRVLFNCRAKDLYSDGILFNNLEYLKLCIRFDYWSKLLYRLLQDSPNLQRLLLYVDVDGRFNYYEPISWNKNQISVPTCLLESLEMFKFAGYRGSQEERDFVSFIFENACHLKYSSITPCSKSTIVPCSSTGSS